MSPAATSPGAGPGSGAASGHTGPAARRSTPRRRTDPSTGPGPAAAADLFWDLAGPMLANPAVQRSTMMGLPCLRHDGRFFGCLDRGTGALLVKLPAPRVAQLIAAGQGEAFAPAGRVFREWVAIPTPDRGRWQALLAEARALAAGTGTGTGAGGGPTGAGGGGPDSTISRPGRLRAGADAAGPRAG